MAQLEELVLNLVAETTGLRSELEKASKATQKATDTMEKAVDELSKNSGKSLSFLEQSFATMTGFLASNVVTGAVNNLKQAFTFLKNEMNEGAKAANEEELQLTRLANALQLSGQYSRDAFNGLKEFSDEMERSTGIEAELVQANLALLSSMTKLDSEGLKKAQKAALDLSNAYNVDLKTATQLIGKGIEGNTSQFSRYGIAVEEGATKAENLANIQKALSGIQGAAAGTAETFTGLQVRLANNYGKISEEAAKTVVQNEAVREVMKTLSAMLDETASSIQGNNTSLKQLVGEGLVLFIDTLVLTTITLDTLMRAGTGVFRAIESTILSVATAATGLLSIFEDEFDEAFETLNKMTQESMDSMAKAFTEDSKLGDITVKLMELGNAATKGLGAIKDGAESVIEPTVKAGEAIDALTEKQIANATKGQEIAEQLILSMEENNATKLALLEEYQVAEDELILEAYNNKLISEEEFLLARAELNEKYDKMIKDNFVKNEQAKAQNASKWASYHLDLANNVGNLLIAVQGRNSKAAFVIQKAAAIAQSIVATNLAAAQALAVPPAPNVGLAGVAKAAGYANTAAIVATAVQGLNKGIDSVPGVGNTDTVPAMLTPGERVVDQGTNRDLKQYLANANSRGNGQMGGKLEVSFKDDIMNYIEVKLIERQRTGESLLPRNF